MQGHYYGNPSDHLHCSVFSLSTTGIVITRRMPNVYTFFRSRTDFPTIQHYKPLYPPMFVLLVTEEEDISKGHMTLTLHIALITV